MKKYRSRYIPVRINGKSTLLHLAIAEKALGKPLPSGAVVHHIDGDRHNNSTSNLIICPSQEYHLLLHKRERALIACGDASWLKCRVCNEWDDPKNLHTYKPLGGGARSYHVECDRKEQIRRKHRKHLKDRVCV